MARDEPLPPGVDPRQQLRSLLGMAIALNRTLVLPATGVDGYVPAGVPTRPPDFLRLESLPKAVRSSHIRIRVRNDGEGGLLDDAFKWALRAYRGTRLLEIEAAFNAFCGFRLNTAESRADSERYRVAEAAVPPANAASTGPASLIACTTSPREAEVVWTKNVGLAGITHQVTMMQEALPPTVRSLPAGSDIMVTFATGSAQTLARNWILVARRAGIETLLIGAIDAAMMRACEEFGLPCVQVDGGSITKALASSKTANIRGDPSIYPKMSTLKVGFYRQLLGMGWNVWACDADALFFRDPRPLMRQAEWAPADITIATDCIDVPSDARAPLTHCDFNTGLVYLRNSPAVIEFTDAWREFVATATELRIRDQAALNMITKQKGLNRLTLDGGGLAKRIFLASNGAGQRLKLGVLPLARFLNGHTFFVQHVHTLPDAEPPLSVHMTYQFAEGSKFPYGKRQRLREAGLWLADDDAYYRGRFLSVSALGATLPPASLGPDIDSRTAVRRHLDEHRHRTSVLRSLLGIAKALGRALILPRMLCYCDFLWKEMRACRVGGAETMRLPFDCPMDHVLDTPKWFEGGELDVDVREPNFLSNPRVPSSVTASVAKVSLPAGRRSTAAELVQHLSAHADAAVIELDHVADRFCGFDDPVKDAHFLKETKRLLAYKRVPFCMMEGSDAPLYSQCCTNRTEGEKFFPCIWGFDDPPDVLPVCGATAIAGATS